MIKKIGIVLLVIIVGFALTLWIVSKPKPEGKSGAEADALAKSMLTALNSEAYDSAKIIKWNFKGLHDYVWDKHNEKVQVTWDKTTVDLDLKSKTGTVTVSGQLINDESEVKKALMFFNNDSFWLVAPYKLFDEGVVRSIVETDEGKALMVNYTSGGTTPGDSYVWFVDENNFPIKYQMWVSIIPVGGLEFTWTDWKQFDGGVWLPQNHDGLISIEMNDIEVIHN
ncbi:MAG: hypothetical protein AAFQ94_20635 [Bacteroidota bacterium]